MQLKQEGEQFWKENEPQAYKELKRKSKWETFLDALVEGTLSLQQMLEEQGQSPQEALLTAMREYLTPEYPLTPPPEAEPL